MLKPLIAITARSYRSESDNPMYHENQSYFEYIEKAGGIPVLVPYVSGTEAIEIARRFDGLLMSGGQDVDPSLYHEPVNGTDYFIHENDLSDIALYHAFKDAKKPILGICRGMQMIGVAEGSTLIQDIPSRYHIEHDQKKMVPPVDKEKPAHDVSFFKGTRCHAIFGDCYGVNSFHHQAVAFTPRGFECSGIDENEIIEAIESLSEPFIVGVQWHPERMIEDEKHLQIAKEFIKSCH